MPVALNMSKKLFQTWPHICYRNSQIRLHERNTILRITIEFLIDKV